MPSMPAARSLDATTHGGLVTSGSPTVKVNERDAVRLSDPHSCPQTSPYAHVGGVIRFGGGAGLTVLINRKPATAIEGKAQCLFPLQNDVATASANVYYDITDTLAGLKVTQDLDGTIHIGDHIKIEPVKKRVIHKDGFPDQEIEDDDYAAHVLADICKIASTDVGKERLQRLDASGKDVTIVPNEGNAKNAYSGPLDPAGAKDPKKGSDVKIQYTPEEWPPDSRAEATTSGAEGDVVLFHEMNHADHQTHGNEASTTRDPAQGNYHTQEEYNSIEGDENRYRRARGFPERHDHTHN